MFLRFNTLQANLGRASVHFVTIDKPSNNRINFKAKMPKFDGDTLFSSDTNGSLIAKFIGNRKEGEFTFFRKDFPNLQRFYIQIMQFYGPFDESDTFVLTEEMPSLPMEKSIALIPCYDSEKFIKEVVEGSLKYAKYLLLVDDGSKDSTPDILRKYQEQYPDRVFALIHEQNRGKGHALLSGFQLALEKIDFQALVTMDSDCQHRPEDFPRLSQAIFDGEDFVIGTRVFNEMPFRSRFANTMISFILRSCFWHAPHDTQSGYRAFNKKMIEEIQSNVKGGQYEMEFDCLLYALSHKKRMRSIPISTIYIDDNASSKFSPVRDSIKILKVMFNYACTRPKQQ